MSSIAIAWETPACFERAKVLAEKLSLPLTQAGEPIVLFVGEQQLSLKLDKSHLVVDFASKSLLYRIQHGGGRNQAIARAVGIKGGNRPFIIDATAGLGQDAFVLASLGCRIHCVERSPIIALLLEDGLKRGRNDPNVTEIVQRMHLSIAKAQTVLNTLSDLPDVVYVDPMFVNTNRSALNKLSMRVLREIVGNDNDAAEVLELALSKAKSRVVVKRNKSSETLIARSPDFSVSGGSTRYDVYLTHGNE